MAPTTLCQVPSPVEWIAKTLPAGAVVGVDPFLHGATGMAKIKVPPCPLPGL